VDKRIEFITGAELVKKWKIKKHDLIQIITLTSEHGNQSFNKKLNPYHSTYLKPFELVNPLLVDAHKRAGTKYNPAPWFVKLTGDISIDEALFKVEDVEAYDLPKQAHINKDSDRKNCRERAKKYIEECKTKKTIPSIATAIKIIRSLR
jgi:hypothetical protein